MSIFKYKCISTVDNHSGHKGHYDFYIARIFKSR